MWSETNQAADPARRRPARPGRAARRRAVGVRAAAGARQLDRGRHDRGAEEHRRRARARPAAAGALSGAVRALGRPAGDQARRAGAAGGALVVGGACETAAEGGARTTPRCGTSCARSAGRGSRSPSSTAARAWAPSSWRCCWRSWATRARRRRSCRPPRPPRRSRRAAATRSASRWLPALASGEATAGLGTRALCADGVGASVLVLLDRPSGEAVLRRSAPTVAPAGDDRPDAALRDRRRRRRGAARRRRRRRRRRRGRPDPRSRSPRRSSASRSGRWT